MPGARMSLWHTGSRGIMVRHVFACVRACLRVLFVSFFPFLPPSLFSLSLSVFSHTLSLLLSLSRLLALAFVSHTHMLARWRSCTRPSSCSHRSHRSHRSRPLCPGSRRSCLWCPASFSSVLPPPASFHATHCAGMDELQWNHISAKMSNGQVSIRVVEREVGGIEELRRV